MQISLPLSEHRPLRERWFPNGEWALALVLVFEIAVFSAIGEKFFSAENFFEIIRLSVELGLLSLAMTPIVITGGIDLSVGSMMALAAIVFGAAWRDAGLSIPVAALLALLTGCLGGALNAALITRLNIPPLIVTLGSFSLFRGIAEGITHASINYSGFPASFLWLGQGYLGGVVPVQFPIFLIALAGYAILLHRSAIGRTIYAIGFSPSGARYAGVPVKRLPRCYISFRDWWRVSPRSSTSRTWGRRNRTRVRAMNWPRSPRWFSAERRFLAAAARFGARCSACFRSRFCKTDCGSRRCLRRWRAY